MNRLRPLNARVWRFCGTRPFLAMMAAGALMVAAFPPVSLGLLALVGFLPLLIAYEARLVRTDLSRRRRYWRAFKYSYVFFLVWNLGVGYWLMLTGHGLDTGTQISGFISGLLASTLNPILQSIPVLLFLVMRRRMALPLALIGLVAGFSAFEFLHFNWDLTWSWLTLGHAFAPLPWYVQYIEWTGIIGASSFILTVNALCFVVLRRVHNGYHLRRPVVGSLIGLLLVPVVLWPILTSGARPMLQPTDTIAVRVVQPNIDPYGDKFTGLSARAQINSMLRLIQNEQPEDLDLVVLPETAIPRSIQETTVANNLYVKLLSEPLAPDSISILTGMVAYRIYFPQRGDEIPPSANCNKEKAYCYDNWNAATMLNTGAKPRIYQKAKLVPFSERTPFLEYMEFLEEFNMDLGGAFGSYALPDSLILLRTGKGVPVGPIICYESIFSSYVRRLVDRGAQLLCIVTNDGWWKQTSGYIQHSSYARLRAIETRRAIARSANTGQSCFISPTGRLSHRTPWWEPAVIDDNLPLLTGRTLYVRWRDWWPKLMLGVVVGVLLLGIIRPRRELD